MIDIDAMQEQIRAANPVRDLDQLDSDELARFVALTARPPSGKVVETQPSPSHGSWRRGPVVAIASAAVALGAVAFAVALVGSLGSDGTRAEIAPAATGEASTTLRVPNPALYTKRLVPYPAEIPPPMSTAIGDLEFEVLQFESPAYGLWQVVTTEHGLVSVANERLYWSTDYYNWESAQVNGDTITIVDDDVVVHGGRGEAMRYAWDGTGWVEDAVIRAADIEQFAFGATGAVARNGDQFFYSTDGVNFSPAEQQPSRVLDRGWCPEGWGPFMTEPLLLATDAGYVALVPTATAWWSDEEAVCESVLWFSADGSEWDLVSAESPFGERSAVYRVAERDGRFVAAGGAYLAPAVIWVSDDGMTWERFDIDIQTIDGLFAGELGWVITGAESNYEHQVIMFSADGISWDVPHARPEILMTGYLPPQIAVGDNVIFGIGGPEVLIARLQD